MEVTTIHGEYVLYGGMSVFICVTILCIYMIQRQIKLEESRILPSTMCVLRPVTMEIQTEGRVLGRGRDMSVFRDGQRIRHVIKRTSNTWTGKYDARKNAIVYNGMYFFSPSRFGVTHFKYSLKIDRQVSGWTECECEVGPDVWITLDEYVEQFY